METTAADEARGALAYTAFSLAMVTVRFVGDRLISMAGPARVVRFSGMMAIAGSLLTMLAPDYAAKLIGFAGLGAGFALISPIAYSRAANDDVLSPGAGLAIGCHDGLWRHAAWSGDHRGACCCLWNWTGLCHYGLSWCGYPAVEPRTR